jgi:hypothetical protein
MDLISTTKSELPQGNQNQEFKNIDEKSRENIQQAASEK